MGGQKSSITYVTSFCTHMDGKNSLGVGTGLVPRFGLNLRRPDIRNYSLRRLVRLEKVAWRALN